MNAKYRSYQEWRRRQELWKEIREGEQDTTVTATVPPKAVSKPKGPAQIQSDKVHPGQRIRPRRDRSARRAKHKGAKTPQY